MLNGLVPLGDTAGPHPQGGRQLRRQPMRYTGERICRAADGALDLEEVFYLRPVGDYSDRQGKICLHPGSEQLDLQHCQTAAERYRDLLREVLLRNTPKHPAVRLPPALRCELQPEGISALHGSTSQARRPA